MMQVRRLLCNPMFHVSQVPRAHTSPLRGGFVTHIMRRFDLELFLKNIENYQITEVNLVKLATHVKRKQSRDSLGQVPAMVMMIINSPLSKKYSMKSIRNAWSGAAPLDKGPQARMQALFQPGTPFNRKPTAVVGIAVIMS